MGVCKRRIGTQARGPMNAIPCGNHEPASRFFVASIPLAAAGASAAGAGLCRLAAFIRAFLRLQKTAATSAIARGLREKLDSRALTVDTNLRRQAFRVIG